MLLGLLLYIYIYIYCLSLNVSGFTTLSINTIINSTLDVTGAITASADGLTSLSTVVP
jgi:hypothetical protein